MSYLHTMGGEEKNGGGEFWMIFLGFWGVVMIFWGCGVVLVGVGGIGLKSPRPDLARGCFPPSVFSLPQVVCAMA